VHPLIPGSPLLIHTDLGKIERATLRKIDTKFKITDELHKYLKNTFPEQELWFPAFNYDFVKTRVYDVKNDPVQVGALNESLRNSQEFSRSPVPIFSILRNSSRYSPEFKQKVEPFSKSGEFAELRYRKGSIVFFGASISSLTFIHYLEHLSNVPYRYMKNFEGRLVLDSHAKPVSVSYLVRPTGLLLEYDWKGIHKKLLEGEVTRVFGEFGKYEIYDCDLLAEFMLEMYSKDSMWTLTAGSKNMVSKKLDELGRSFLQGDFEEGEKFA
jgi:hypothetical protein